MSRSHLQPVAFPVIVGLGLVMALLIPDNRFVFLAIWGFGVVFVYGRVLRRRHRRWDRDRTARSYRDLLGAVGLFIVAVASGASIVTILFGPTGTGIRGFAVALALGAFVAAGLVMDDEEPDV